MRSPVPQASGLDASLRDGRSILSPSGELDMATAARCEGFVFAIFMDEDLRELVLDLRGLTFLDAAGLRAILLIRELADEYGCRLGVIPGPAPVQKMFDAAGVTGTLPWTFPPSWELELPKA
jgi:anti-sigma B factor antagonist